MSYESRPATPSQRFLRSPQNWMQDGYLAHPRASSKGEVQGEIPSIGIIFLASHVEKSENHPYGSTGSLPQATSQCD